MQDLVEAQELFTTRAETKVRMYVMQLSLEKDFHVNLAPFLYSLKQ